MRKILRAFRHWPDRLAHARRRREAERVIRSVPISRVVMGCLGNICRSPYAAERLRGARLGIDVDSAGFIGPGRAPPEDAVAAALERGLDVSGHRSRQFRLDDLRSDSLVVVMEPAHVIRLRTQFGLVAGPIILLGDLDPEPIATRIIIDPFGHSLATFATTFERIDRCVTVLIGELQRPAAP